MNIGTKIRELRRARDLTQDEFAELLGVSYRRCRNGRPEPPVRIYR